MLEIECLICGKPTRSPLQWRVYCNDCRERVLLLQVAVSRIMRQYEIPPATAFKCVDCGVQAQAYDHRYYSHPLEVDPVCYGCNQKRGPALDIVPAVVELAHYGITSKYGKPAAPKREYPTLKANLMDLDWKMPLDLALETMQRERIERALVETKHNCTAAARLLGLKYRVLRYRMANLGIA